MDHGDEVGFRGWVLFLVALLLGAATVFMAILAVLSLVLGAPTEVTCALAGIAVATGMGAVYIYYKTRA